MTKHELYHYGVKGMKWGVRRDKAKLKRAKKVSRKKSEYHQRNADRSSKIRDDIEKGNYKKYGYLSDKQAKKDIANWNEDIRAHQTLAKKWLSIHDEISNMSVGDVKKAKQLISNGRKLTNEYLINAENQIIRNAVTDKDA